jgi:Ca2+-binding RTX toxin-like protein
VTFELSGLVGTSGEDNITGTSEQDVIYGLDGSDLINAWAGDDRIFGDLGDDIIYGNSGDDLIFGGKSSDKLFGGDGEDFISGGSGSDNLYGGSENDIISGGRGSDSLYGGDGDDLIYADWSDLYGDSEQADLEESRSLEQEPGWSESIIELFWENYLSGGGGDDILIGGKGADVFVFESGRDVIRGFQIGLDVIAVNRPNMDNLSEDNSPFSSMTDAGLVLDFGNGDEILFEGLFSNNLGGDSIIFYG